MSSLLYVDKEPKPFPYIFFVHRRRKDEEAGVAFPVDQRIYCDADWESFQELIQRGANLWPDAPPEIKEFADLVTNGRVMQDYYKQACIRRCVCGVVLKGGVTHMNCTAGVAERHPRCGYPYCACVGQCFAASQPGAHAGGATDQQTNQEQTK